MKDNNYDLFKISKKNRKLDKLQISKLKNSISEFWYLEFNPIIINEDYEIIDWQHRFEACKQLKLPILYVIQKWDTDKIMIWLNTTSKNWGLQDYIDHYAELGVKWYIYFKEFAKKYNLKLTVALVILTSHQTNTGRAIKNWFEFNKIEYADRIAEIINEFKFILDFAENRTFTRAIIKLYIKAWEKWINKLLENPMIIRKQMNIFDYCNVFENIINKWVHSNNKISLSTKNI